MSAEIVNFAVEVEVDDGRLRHLNAASVNKNSSQSKICKPNQSTEYELVKRIREPSLTV